MAAAKAKYLVKVGMNYPPNDRRAEIGDIVDDLPAKSIRSLREQGVIVQVDAKGNTVDATDDDLSADADPALLGEEG